MENPTDQQLVAMTQQYSLTKDGVYICHEAYRLINEQVKKGRPWSKCPNCGNPYAMDTKGANTTTCTEKCLIEFTNYVMAEGEDW